MQRPSVLSLTVAASLLIALLCLAMGSLPVASQGAPTLTPPRYNAA